jgi:S-adenosylmethionine:tRNA ribosyltransferase-isomerase
VECVSSVPSVILSEAKDPFPLPQPSAPGDSTPFVSDFDYHLPPERIAQTPVEPRDSSRLLVVHRDTGRLEHRTFRDIGDYLAPGDLLVANDSRVLHGRLWARKPTGGRVELLLLRQSDQPGDWWEALARPANRLRAGQCLLLEAPAAVSGASAGDDVPPLPLGEGRGEGSAANQRRQHTAEVGPRTPAGGVLVRFDAPAEEIAARYGQAPLPPYIHAPLADPERYQTVYSRVTGSAAAPTAGLHFTPELLDSLSARGVRLAFVTLHVGLDTFRPIQAERVADHTMHSEFVAVPDATAAAIAETRRAGRRVVAIGTTAVRSLESWAIQTSFGDHPDAPPGDHSALSTQRRPERSEGSSALAWSGWTSIFIYPGYRFRAVDALITNFHLPRSTLLMLVSAFAGPDLIRRAYAEAIAREYRFFSFGDATLML